jgi:hypothetical protein
VLYVPAAGHQAKQDSHLLHMLEVQPACPLTVKNLAGDSPMGGGRAGKPGGGPGGGGSMAGATPGGPSSAAA